MMFYRYKRKVPWIEREGETHIEDEEPLIAHLESYKVAF